MNRDKQVQDILVLFQVDPGLDSNIIAWSRYFSSKTGPIIRTDEKNYFYDEKRKFIKHISLPSLDKDEIYDNDRLLQAVGRTIVETLLPLEEQWPPPEK